MTWRVAFASVSTPGEDMRKPLKTVVVAVLLGAVGFLGTGTAYAHGQADGHKHGREHGREHGKGHGHGHGKGHGRKHQERENQTLHVNQSTTCTTTEANVDVQGETAFDNGLAESPNAEGAPVMQNTNVGSTLGCNNTIVFGG
jgi:amino acid transporter